MSSPCKIGFSECQELADELGIEIVKETPEPGDLYIAGRNTEPQLLECDKLMNGAVFPKGGAYPYDTHECFKVINE